MAAKLSVVINTYNEAKVLPRLLNSIKDLVDEIVVIDTESTDNSREIAKKFGAKVFPHSYSAYVEPLRNFGISKATGEWILVLDPDEEIPPILKKKIRKIVHENKLGYYRIPRKNIIFGKWLKHSRWWPDYNIRLFKKGTVSWNEVIHSVPVTQGDGYDMDVKEEFAIIHHHYDSIDQYIDRMNRYTSQQSKMKLSENYKFSWKDLISKPAEEFFSRYFFGEGYKDGVHGLSVSILQGFSELVLYLKIWQAEKFRDEEINLSDIISEMRLKEKDLHFWQNNALYKQTGSLTARLKRKLRI
ncbi:MAG TPA: glycosyltransferase family 2 protein [Patescibacteria group bacterium]|nr:glycosyltransferase family 2 protein [Patescibacteria group bacterium]